MGQFATSPALAADILRYAAAVLDENNPVRFIDPAIGTGSFYSALLDVFPKKRIACATGYEMDPHYGVPAVQLWGQTGLDMRLKDFTQAEPPQDSEKFNLLICNPPYVRHHHIVNGEKQRLKLRAHAACSCGVRWENQRSRRVVLLLSWTEPSVDGSRRVGWLANPQRIHGRQLWRLGRALPARQGDAPPYSSLRPERGAIRRRTRVLRRGVVPQGSATARSPSAVYVRRITGTADAGAPGAR